MKIKIVALISILTTHSFILSMQQSATNSVGKLPTFLQMVEREEQRQKNNKDFKKGIHSLPLDLQREVVLFHIIGGIQRGRVGYSNGEFRDLPWWFGSNLIAERIKIYQDLINVETLLKIFKLLPANNSETSIEIFKKIEELPLMQDPRIIEWTSQKYGQYLFEHESENYWNVGNLAFKINSLLLQQKGKININWKDRYGRTTLFKVTNNGLHASDVESVKTLLEHGADPNIADNEGYTPLIQLTVPKDSDMQKDIEIVQMLLAKEANPNLRDTHGLTALSWAASCEKDKALEIVRVLLKSKADPNISTNEKITPLMWAVKFDNKEIVKLLLAANANIGHKDDLGRTVFDWARLGRKVEILELLNQEVEKRKAINT